jgi:HK97 family phage portal protein
MPDKPALKLYTGYGGSGGSRLVGLLPGTKYDWAFEAGDIYLNDVVSLGVNWVADKLNMVPLVVQERQADNTYSPIFDNPLAALWARSNDNYDSYTRDLALGMSLITSGNAFLFIERGGVGGLPIGLYWLDQRYMYPVYPTDGSRYLDGWNYRIDGKMQFIPKENILHFRWGIDPLNDRLGLSKLKAVLRQICLLNESAGYAVSILKNSGVPGLIVMPTDSDDELTDEDGLAIKSTINKMTTGDKRGSTIAVNRRIKLETIGFTPEQMALDKLPQNAVPLVCGAIGTPPEVLGLPSATKTYDNYATAKRSAWESGVLPILKLIRETVSRKLMPEFGLDSRRCRLEHDTKAVADLQENQDAIHKRALDAYLAGTITLNMFLEETGRTGDTVMGDRYRWEIENGNNQPPTSGGGNLFG